MSNKRITQLEELLEPVADDLLVIVDESETDINKKTKRIKIANLPGAEPSPSSLAELTDTEITEPVDGEALVYDNEKWINRGLEILDIGGLTDALNLKIEDLSGFTTTDLAEGDNLYFTAQRAIDALTNQNVSIFTNDAGYLTSADLPPEQDLFSVIEIDSDNFITADSPITTLRIEAGENITIEADNLTKTVTISAVVNNSDFLASLAGLEYAQGDILYYDGANLNRLPAGTSGYFLKTNGAGANPEWSEVIAGGSKWQETDDYLETIDDTPVRMRAGTALQFGDADRYIKTVGETILEIGSVSTAGGGLYLVAGDGGNIDLDSASVNIQGETTLYSRLSLMAGTTDTAPLIFSSGSLLTSPQVGAMELLTNDLYFTITTGVARKPIVLADEALVSGRVPYTTTNGRLKSSANFTFDGDNIEISGYLETGATGQSVLIKGLILNSGQGGSGTDALWVKGGSDANLFYVNPVTDRVGISTLSPTAKLDVNSDIIRLRTEKTPASASATGNKGDICWDSGFIYVCVDTDTWERAELNTWA